MNPIFNIVAMQFASRATTELEPATLRFLFPGPGLYQRFYMDGRTYVRREAAKLRMRRGPRSEARDRVR